MAWSAIGKVRQRLDANVFKTLRLGRRYWDVGLSNISDDKNYKGRIFVYDQNLLDNIHKGIGLVLLGDYRTGKTSIGSWLLKRVYEEGGTSLFVRYDEITSSVLEKTGFSDRETLYQRMVGVDLLMIDDVGTGNMNDLVKGMFEMVCRKRYDNSKSTILTTNYPEKAFSQIVGAGLYKMLRSTCDFIICDGEWK